MSIKDCSFLQVRQLNSMGMEGIYAEDDVPDYAGSAILPPTMIRTPSMAPGSIAFGPPSYASKTGPGSIVLVNGGVYTEPQTQTTQNLHFEGNPGILKTVIELFIVMILKKITVYCKVQVQ